MLSVFATAATRAADALREALDADLRRLKNLEGRQPRLDEAAERAETALADAAIEAAGLEDQTERRGARRDHTALHEAAAKALAERDTNRRAADTLRERIAAKQRGEAEREAAEIEAARRAKAVAAARKLRDAVRALDVAGEAAANALAEATDAWDEFATHRSPADLDGDQWANLTGACAPRMLRSQVEARIRELGPVIRGKGDPNVPAATSAEAILMNREGFAALIGDDQ